MLHDYNNWPNNSCLHCLELIKSNFAYDLTTYKITKYFEKFKSYRLFCYYDREPSMFLTAAAVLGITFTPPPPHLSKTDENFCQKAELGYAQCNFQNSDKKYSAYMYGVCTKRLFLP